MGLLHDVLWVFDYYELVAVVSAEGDGVFALELGFQ
jgi:hypothetical protein